MRASMSGIPRGSSYTATLEASIRARHLRNIWRAKESSILSAVRGIRMTTPASSRSISVLKKEGIHLHTYQNSREARRAIFEYIEGWYNRKRIHSAIGYITPRQKEDEELKKAA